MYELKCVLLQGRLIPTVPFRQGIEREKIERKIEPTAVLVDVSMPVPRFPPPFQFCASFSLSFVSSLPSSLLSLSSNIARPHFLSLSLSFFVHDACHRRWSRMHSLVRHKTGTGGEEGEGEREGRKAGQDRNPPFSFLFRNIGTRSIENRSTLYSLPLILSEFCIHSLISGMLPRFTIPPVSSSFSSPSLSSFPNPCSHLFFSCCCCMVCVNETASGDKGGRKIRREREESLWISCQLTSG